MRRKSSRRLWPLFKVGAWLLVLALFLSHPAPALAGEVRYTYDDLNRLVGIVDPSGEAAQYTYDAAGNLLAITRYSSGQVTLLDFSPHSGPVGATVTLFGTGFSPTPSQNTVSFNGVSASVTSATPTQLVAAVPAGAATGPIASPRPRARPRAARPSP